MVTAADIRFWTNFEVSEEDATRFSSAVLPVFLADGGDSIHGEQRTRTLCYLIAAGIESRNGSPKLSESLGGYSYSKKSPTSSSYWIDLYHEILFGMYASALLDERTNVRCDRELIQMNRRF